VGVEPTGDGETRRPPVLKTGTITGPHALPCYAAAAALVRVRPLQYTQRVAVAVAAAMMVGMNAGMTGRPQNGPSRSPLNLLAWKSPLMEDATKWSTLKSIFQQRCPRCRTGSIFHYSIFRGFPKMHQRCPACGLKFEREPGYFLGAMYISYAIGIVVIALFAAGFWWATRWWITTDTIWAVVLFLPLAPTITLLARVLWIYLDQAIDPERPR
jgi:uncharacterized protein (DUF983 family)